MSNARARLLLWSPVALAAIVPFLPWRDAARHAWLGWLFAAMAVGYYLLTGFLAALAGWQANQRHPRRLITAVGAGALVTASVAAPLVVWSIVDLFGAHAGRFDATFVF